MYDNFNILDKINKKSIVDTEYDKYNNTDESFDIKTLHELFMESASKFPDNIAVIEGENKITYRELDEKSNQVARHLIKVGAKNNELIAIYVPRKLTTIINILGILKAGCAYVPIDVECPEERVQYILKDSKCNIVMNEDYFKSNNIKDYSIEKVDVNGNIEDLAYVIYTSGSTGVPKGVKISHKGACNTILDIINKFNINTNDRIIALSSMCFDLSVFDIFGTLASGAVLVEINDQRDIRNIKEILKKERITIWNSIPSTMQILVDNMKEGYENNTLRLVLLSGDWISLKLPEKIKKYFKRSVNVSLGGATEASIWSIYYEIKDVNDGWKSIPYGVPLANQKMYILNKEGRLCPKGVVGEIYIGGIGIAEGYVNNPDKTEESFIQHKKLGRIYKTGDFGIFNKLGYIEFVGRKDNQVKIRGYRVEFGEVESVVNSYEGIKIGIVAARKDNMGNSYLCAYYVLEKEINFTSFKRYLRDKLPQYMIPSRFIKLETVPLTSNGKIDRKHLPEPKEIEEDTEKQVEVTDEIEKKLIKICEGVFGDGIKLGTQDNFFEIGINSILMVSIIAQIEDEFNIQVKFKEFLKNNNICELADFVRKRFKGKAEKKVKKKVSDEQNIHEPFPISDVQIAYLMGRDNAFELGGVSTHAYGEIESKLDINRFNNSLQKVIDRHPILRSVVLSNGTQKILKNVPKYKIEVVDYSNLSEEELNRNILEERNKLYHHVFKTDEWPLFKFKAYKTYRDSYYIFIEYDLIIGDGMSMRILSKELIDYYVNPDIMLPKINYNFRDYMIAYEEFKQSQTYLDAKKYWLDKIEDFPSSPNLPYKQEPSKVKEPHFARISNSLNKEQLLRLRDRAKEHSVTISALLCTVFSEVLGYWSNQPHHAVNLTVFNRYPFNEDVEKIIGDFTSSMIIDVDLTLEDSFWNKCKNVQNTLMEALENRHYNGIEFIRELSKYNHTENKAIMPIVFTSMIFDEKGTYKDESEKIGEVKFEGSQTSQVFLDFQVSDDNGILKMSWDYVEELFDKDMINEMFHQYIDILINLVNYKDDYKFELSDESYKLIQDYNNTDEEIESGVLYKKIYEQSKVNGDKIALKFKDEELTYRELNEKSNQVANYLKAHGIGRNDFVGVLGKRCPRTIINILGVLKAGAGYVPIDPNYPQERIKFILNSCKAKYYLSNYYENDIEKYEKLDLEIVNSKKDIAYVIFTSGSTGTPKGVQITHEAAFNTICDINNKFNVNSEDKILGISSMCFDLSVYDIFGAQFAGAKLIQIEDQRNINNLVEVIKKEQVSICNSVPAIMEMLVDNLENDELIDSLRLILLSGDWISIDLPNKIKNHFKNAKVLSLGGATEASIWSIYYPIDKVKKEWSSIPYGIPLANQKFYVLNYNKELCPIGVSGELYIGGVGVSAGYINNEEKNRESFMIHPEFGRIYNTGDYGVLEKDGYIRFLGRKDNQVKIRGYRIELEEIERNLLKIQSIENALVTDLVDDDKKFLYAYIISNTEINESNIKEELSKYLPDYMIPDHCIKIDKIPLTANGKVNRKELPKVKFKGVSKKNFKLPENELQREISDIWEEILNIEKVSINDNFYDLGGQSILMIRMIAKIEKKLKVKISYSEFINNCTIEKLSEVIKTKNKGEVFVYPQAIVNQNDINEPFKLTEVQMAYLMGRNNSFDLGGISTHLYTEIETGLNIDRLSESLQKTIERHPMMRAIVRSCGEQVILKDVPKYEIKVEDVSELAYEEQSSRILEKREKLCSHIFKTDKWPLFNFEAFKLSDNKYYLFIEFDQLIADGMSIQIITKDLISFYKNPNQAIKETDFSFRDYIIEYSKFKNSYKYKEDKKYWLDKLDDFASAPALPVKEEKNSYLGHSFKRLTKVFEKEDWNKLRDFAKKINISPSALLCSIYSKVLSIWSNQKRLAINLTVFNRYPFHKDVNKLVGDFTSVILLDVDTENSNNYVELGKNVQKVLIESLEHRHYEGVEFIREIAKKNNVVNKSLMPVVFTSMLFGDMDDNNTELYKEIGDRKFVATQTSQVYLDHQVSDSNDVLTLTWDYVDEMFDEKIINDMFKQYIYSIKSIIEGNNEFNIKLSDEDKEIITNYNATDDELKNTTLVNLFNETVNKYNNSIAIIDGDRRCSYEELNKESNKIANYLIELGIKKKDFVGVICHRSIETLYVVLGILKVGAAYIPIDPTYPKERIDYITQNSNCDILVDSKKIEKILNNYSEKLNSVLEVNPEDIAYIIYTSGSTGNPKGVKISHRAVVNTILDVNKKYNVTEKDRILAISSMCFDLSVYDIFGAFTAGASLVIVPNQKDVKGILELINKHKITIWNSVPAIMNMVVEYLNQNKESNYSWDDDTSSEFEEDKNELENIYTWSPVVMWKINNGCVFIGDEIYEEEVYLDLLPELYFFTQDGAAIDEIKEHFSHIENADEAIDNLIKDKVLIDEIVKVEDLFGSQDKLFRHKYGTDLILKKEAYEKFKIKQLNRKRSFGKSNKSINLDESLSLPSYVVNRRSCRKFCEGKKVPFNVFSMILSTFKQRTLGNGHKVYNYASAGGLYPIDVYVYVKENRVENIDKGLYYYNPINNKLILVEKDNEITSDAHYFTNKNIFNSSAFSFYFIYNAAVTMPRYSGAGYLYSLIDTGIMVSTLTEVCEKLNLGLCSIGDMNFEKIRANFKLDKNQVFIHTVEGGIKENDDELLIPEDKLIEIEEDSKFNLIDYSSLRLVLLSGDWISLDLPGKIKDSFINSKVVSLGGATEVSIWSIYYDINEIDESWSSIPYGFPLANQKIYILSDDRKILPIDTAGEIYIGGIGVSDGYANDPKKDSIAFIDDDELGRIYKTGDYGVMRKEGYVEFLGRKDNQVKVNGFRIELEEIENRLKKHPDIKECVVTVQEGKKYICAYYISDKTLSSDELKEYLNKSLTDYMIPNYFMQLDSLPLTENGKVNKKVLPKVDICESVNTVYVAPRNKEEKEICNIIAEVLEIQQVGMEDDFFELNGDSLKATKLIVMLENAFNVEIGFEIFANSKVKEISNYVLKVLSKNKGVDNIIRLRSGKKRDKNIFFFSDVVGDIYQYVKLTSDIDKEYNCYGVKANWFDLVPVDITIEEMSKRYLEEILRIQSKGEYCLIGWSFGGLIANEVARQLKAKGKDVKLLGIIDTLQPESNIVYKDEFSLEKEKEVVAKYISKDILKKNIVDLESLWKNTIEYLKDNPEVFEKFTSSFGELSFLIKDKDPKVSVTKFNLFRTLSKAEGIYHPEGKINVQALIAKALNSFINMDSDKWQMYFEKVKIYIFNTDHIGILQGENAVELLQYINEILDN